MPPRSPYDDDYDRRRDDGSIGEKFVDLANAIKDKTGEALEDVGDKIRKTKQEWDRRDDDDDNRPVFRGTRNYEGVGVGVGEALGDFATAVKRTTDQLVGEAKKSETFSKFNSKLDDAMKGPEKKQGWRKRASTNTLTLAPLRAEAELAVGLHPVVPPSLSSPQTFWPPGAQAGGPTTAGARTRPACPRAATATCAAGPARYTAATRSGGKRSRWKGPRSLFPRLRAVRPPWAAAQRRRASRPFHRQAEPRLPAARRVQ